MLTLALCLVITMGLAAVIERLAKPASASRSFPHRASLLNLMPIIVTFATMLMLSYRPIFSLAATVITFGGVVVVNNAKYAILREPLVFSDFALLREAVRHPQLYLRYIGVLKVVGIVVVAAAAIAAGLVFEAPLLSRTEPQDYIPTLIYVLGLVGLIYAITNGPLRRPMRDFLRQFGATTDVSRDMDQLSLVVCLVIYFFLAHEPPRRKEPKPQPGAAGPVTVTELDGHDPQRLQSLVPARAGLPDIVAVQSESFFDARLVHPSLPSDLLRSFDRACGEALYHGRLAVPAWGANTMRTEFAFLSGLPNEALGANRFNPYRLIRNQPVWTLAHQLRALGYRTVCIHPFDPSFFDRDKVYPNLGFDLFLDVRDFAGAATFGPYISDTAVADKIIEQLGLNDGRPCLIFAITMENHGRWETGRLDGEPAAGPFHNQAPLGSPAFGCYLTHLQHTEVLIERVTAALRGRQRPGVFALYGDHVPGLTDIFATTGFDDPRTDYFIWRSDLAEGQRMDTSADTLGRLLLHAAFGVTEREDHQERRTRGNAFTREERGIRDALA